MPMPTTIVELSNAVVGSVRPVADDRVAIHLACGKIGEKGKAFKDCQSIWYTVFMDKADAPALKSRVDARGYLQCRDGGKYGIDRVLNGARIRAHADTADVGDFED